MTTFYNRVCQSCGRSVKDEDMQFHECSSAVSHPSHYTTSGIECIDAIQAQLTEEEFRGYIKGNVAKYNWRERHKNGLEDLKKAKWYLDKLIEVCEDVGRGDK